MWKKQRDLWCAQAHQCSRMAYVCIGKKHPFPLCAYVYYVDGPEQEEVQQEAEETVGQEKIKEEEADDDQADEKEAGEEKVEEEEADEADIRDQEEDR